MARERSRSQPRVAVLIPCYNEAGAISQVVHEMKRALPDASIYVYDNNSTDNTKEIAAAAGALVRSEPSQGKGFVVRRMFADVDADVYVLVDGDATYDAAAAPALVEKLIHDRLDMVNGARVTDIQEAYRPGHRFGNWMLTTLVQKIFGNRIGDLLSGYRAFSRRYVKSFPAQSTGFEIETELTVHALELSMPIAEVQTTYRDRPVGTQSKLRTYRDGVRILATITNLVRDEKPLVFFSGIGAMLVVTAVLLTIPIFATYFHTGLVPRFPTAILATGLVILSMLSFTCGLILDSVARTRKQLKWLHYLSVPPWSGDEST